MPLQTSSNTTPDSIEQLVTTNKPFSLDDSLSKFRSLQTGQQARPGNRHWWQRLSDWWAARLYSANPIALRNYELKWRINARKRYGRAFFAILAVQNTFVLWLVYSAYVDGRLEELAVILGVLVSGTLAETYFIFRIIVTELFKEIKYQDYISPDSPK